MINDVKQAIVNKLLELYPDYIIYDEDIPQNFKTPSFLISLIEQSYSKRLNNKYQSLLSFDIAYFSHKRKTEIKSDCLSVQLNLLREFDLIDTYRVLNKQATITDDVLHITFDINYSEIKEEEFVKMQKQTTNTNI
ncbi:hypothetical protein SAMN02745135_01171 [Caloranaerobacter azorensis DSM 13643]|uniref:Phage protein n=1 Tax=Caloranaerobacter azorensis DSM 13643 TaxID=1121264 RepID=A0A1M5TW36_9FIRM|nr:hypothetical protein [Caloranaerobacter azorensis]SHH55002.1 hypothetical protein SAMN02745135_01171 [Caloranaerobacter azorensis DSM 13643]